MVRLRGDEKAHYVANMFARISGRYDLLNTVMTAGMHHRWRRKTAAVAVQGEEGEALDVATGTGDLALALARRPGVSRVVGLDFVPQMVSLAQRKADKTGLSHQVHWVIGDALALPFPDDRFLCATSGFSLRNFSNVPQALKEMIRVLRPGGRVALLEITPLQGKGLFTRLFRLYFRRVTPWLGAMLAGDREAYAYLPDSVEVFHSAPKLAEMMAGIGLQGVQYQLMGLGTVALHVGQKPG